MIGFKEEGFRISSGQHPILEHFRGWQRRLHSDIEILRVNLMPPAEAATGIKRTRKIKLL
jgi:hypothetical protein